MPTEKPLGERWAEQRGAAEQDEIRGGGEHDGEGCDWNQRRKELRLGGKATIPFPTYGAEGKGATNSKAKTRRMRVRSFVFAETSTAPFSRHE